MTQAGPGVRGLVPLGIAVAVGLGAGARPPVLADVEDVRVWRQPDHTRVVVELSRETAYRAHVLPDPPRLYIDLQETWIAAAERVPRALDPASIVRSVRGGQNTLTRARVVVELDSGERPVRVFHLERPFRVVAQVLEDGPGEALGEGRAPVATAVAIPRAKPRPGQPGLPEIPRPKPRAALAGLPPVPRSKPRRWRAGFDLRPVRVVMLDAGHGGRDPGALGVAGHAEKDIVLPVVRALRAELEARDFQVQLTRNGDTFLELDERTRLANRARADLFISIHANAAPRPESHGVETYFLDTRSDRQAARLAARENGTPVEELDALERVLVALRLGYNERFAARFAEDVQSSLVARLRRSYPQTRDLGTKRGPFLVLFTAEMPAILVEVGFVSNPAEAGRLASRSFVAAAAEGIAEGVVEYADRHARSLVAEQ